MNVLLTGGSGSLINHMIIKLNKEGHRVYLLTGNRYSRGTYQRVYERYDFSYDCNTLNEIIESASPDVIIYMGAYDTNFRWKDESAESVRYASCLLNVLMGYVVRGRGRFIYLSSHGVYEEHYAQDIQENEPKTPISLRGMALAQAEELCESFRKNRGLDIVTLRLDHVYGIPKTCRDVTEICTQMCLEAMQEQTITVEESASLSPLYETDAVEYIYRIAACEHHRYPLYHISASRAMTQRQLAEIVRDAMGNGAEIVTTTGVMYDKRVVLFHTLFESEFGCPFFCDIQQMIGKIADGMKKDSYIFLNGEESRPSLWNRFLAKAGWLVGALIPFVENMIIFIPFFMMNNRAVTSKYFARLDVYLLYVLLFAIVYGQHQAVFSAILAVAGFCFRQMYNRTGYEVLIDGNTYVWIAQLFIVGLVVGYMRDQLKKLKTEKEEEREFLSQQLDDIQDINSSNVRVKDALATQVINQSDSIGKIYRITSTLDQRHPEEILFYATEMLGTLVKSRDVAIYIVSNNSGYARLFASTSKLARSLGTSIQYKQMGVMYETISERKVFINREMDSRYPLMANAIYDDDDEIQLLLMIWGIPWESMTLGNANLLVVISALIQNAVLRANRYLTALENQRHVEDTQILEAEAFTLLVNVYLDANDRRLTECTLLQVGASEANYKQIGKELVRYVRQTDYIGRLQDGGLYVLLSSTSNEDAQYVIERLANVGLESRIVKAEAA